MVTLLVNPEYVKYINDQVSDQVNDLIFNSLEEIISYVNEPDDQVSDQVSDQVQNILNNQLHYRVEEILNLTTQWIKRDVLFAGMNLSNHHDNRIKYLDPLLKIDWIEMEFHDKKTSPNQRYRITTSGKRLLKIIQTINLSK
jgi:ATP-dependent DNA helicase RecG